MLYNFILKNYILFSILFFSVTFLVICEIMLYIIHGYSVCVIKLIDIMNKKRYVILDFRSFDKFKKKHISNSKNIRQLSPKLLNKYSSNKLEIVVISINDFRSYKIVKNIRITYSNCYFLRGGIDSWIKKDMPIEKLN